METNSIDWSLYALLDKAYHRGRAVQQLAEAVIEGGAGILQIRDKISASNEFYSDVLRVKAVTDQYRIPLIVNDRVDIALAAGTEGVHIGHDDLPFQAVRRLIGQERLLGASVHSTEELNTVLQAKPDYIGVGTIYSSTTKGDLKQRGPDILREIRRLTELPMIAIGGITADNLRPVFEAGADGIAVSSYIFAGDDLKSRTRKIRMMIKEIQQRNDA